MQKTETNMIDESLYSRQLYAIGKDAMAKMTKADILITCGENFTGSALELAKCIILAGVKSVTLHSVFDRLTYRNIGSNYFTNESDIGKPYLDTMVRELRELNTYVQVNKTKTIDIDKYTCIVFCDYNVHQLFYWNEKCRQSRVKFIMLQSYGLTFNLFCDFGDDHIINDDNGEPLASGIIERIEKGIFVTSDPHLLSSGDIVVINMNNTTSQYLVRSISSNEFEVCECNNLVNERNYLTQKEKQMLQVKMMKGGLPRVHFKDTILNNTTFQQKKIPTSIRFKNLESSLENPDIVIFDTHDWKYSTIIPKIQNIFMQALSIWKITHRFNYIPSTFHTNVFQMFPTTETEYAELRKIFDTLFAFNKDYEIRNIGRLNQDKKLDAIVDLMIRTCKGNVCGVDAVAGSLCAQEVIKAVSNKFIPNMQFMHFSALNIFPDVIDQINLMKSNPKNYMPIMDRYDNHRVIFGSEYLQYINKQKVFIVGAGAIGCEHIKNFSMMGIGKIIVTDMDHIENSNLNRQFLFRKENIGFSKSLTAANKARRMNPHISITSQENKVCSETLDIYNADFFNDIDIVANALDNIEARQFMDGLCVKYKKPLLESGTLGVKGSIQCVIPDLTEPYSALSDPPEKNIPQCTLKMFPYKYEHVVQYARDVFEGYFNRIPQNYLKSIYDSKLHDATFTELHTILEDIIMLTKNCGNFKNCISLAYKQWHVLFRDNINHIIKKYPSNHIDTDGVVFWSGNRIFPKVVDFDIKNNIHFNFVFTFSHLWADMLNIDTNKRYTNRSKFAEFLSTLKSPRPTKDSKIDESTMDESTRQKYITNIKEHIQNKKQYLKSIAPITFEKDDDTNNHIDFITSCANLRADNYNIEPKDRLTTKGLAGKIIPAIATTTSIVSGLTALEMYKVIYGSQNKNYNTLDRYRYGSFNLAVQMFGFGESTHVKEFYINGKSFSVWSRLKIDPHIPLIDAFNKCSKSLTDLSELAVTKKKNDQDTRSMSIESIFYDNQTLFSVFDDIDINDDDMNYDNTEDSDSNEDDIDTMYSIGLKKEIMTFFKKNSMNNLLRKKGIVLEKNKTHIMYVTFVENDVKRDFDDKYNDIMITLVV